MEVYLALYTDSAYGEHSVSVHMTRGGATKQLLKWAWCDFNDYFNDESPTNTKGAEIYSKLSSGTLVELQEGVEWFVETLCRIRDISTDIETRILIP
tara:strand:+ start:144 stop:434 length:291 start_codon:yes stop_codon:yes gene_type:complete